MNIFSFKGGLNKPCRHVTEKMVLFAITSYGNEIMLYDALKSGLVKKVNETNDNLWDSFRPQKTLEDYASSLQYFKLFVHKTTYNGSSAWWSWYLQLDEREPKVTIHSFGGERSPLVFSAKCKILTDKEVLEKLNLEECSKAWLGRVEGRPPDEVLKSMVEIETIDPKKDFRKIRIRRKTDERLGKGTN